MPAIDFRHLSKRFNNVVALDDITLSLPASGVHGLLGENGAGKSTIMNVLYGLLKADSGEILLDNHRVAFRSPGDAIGAGIGMVHQHFMLAGAMTVLDNVLLGDRREGQIVNRQAAAKKLIELGERLSLPVDPAARVETLSVGQQQRVEILKALYRDVQVLILDEPTAVLTPMETDQLLGAMRRLRDQGTSVIFISHKLNEVLSVCDDISILRRGKLVWQGRSADANAGVLAQQMIGSDSRNTGILPVSSVGHGQDARVTKEVIVLEQVGAAGIDNISFSLGAGILGIAGVDGNGQQELAEVLVGLRETIAGKILFQGRPITDIDFTSRSRLGIAHIPNDRKREGLVGSMSIVENIALKHHRCPPFSRMGFMSWSDTRHLADSLVKQFDVRHASLDMPVGALSGGNQQKIVLARELAVVKPNLIVAINPTRGLDIAATQFVHQQLLKHRAEGCAIILISSELDELIRVSDRIAVLYRGRLTMSRFPDGDTSEIGKRMAGLD